MFFVGAIRRLVAVLVLAGIGVTPSLLDGCLMSCHSGPGAVNARTGHCHAAPTAETTSHLQSIPHCCHDVTTGLAEATGAGSRTTAASFVPHAVNLVVVPDRLDRAVFVSGASQRSLPFQTRLIPLRL
jgi:hypothetical protein